MMLSLLKDSRAVALLLAASLTILSNSLISPSLPGIEARFADEENAALLARLLVTAPSLMVAILAPFAGALADRFGRRLQLLAGVALFAVAAFPLPAVGESSPEHRYSAMAGFVLLALWPVLSMRFSPRYPWLVRPLGATLSTLAVGAACVAFAWIEASPDPALVGLAERVAAYLESLWPAVVVLALALRDRRVSAREPKLRGG